MILNMGVNAKRNQEGGQTMTLKMGVDDTEWGGSM